MENPALAPVVLMAYARPEHTKKTLDALAANLLAKESVLYLFCDGPKHEGVAARNQQVRCLLEEEKAAGRFARVELRISSENKGLAKSIIGGVSEIIAQHGRCIVVEDDLVTAPEFLTFMNQCLDFYRSDSSIWAISGFTFPLRALRRYNHDVYLSYRACSHGWATWQDRWETVDWQVSDFAQLEKSPALRRKFNRGGNDLFRMLRHQMRGERDSWAIRFCYAQSKQNRFAVYPRQTLVNNIGFDGSGTHCEQNQRLQQLQLGTAVANLKPEIVTPNRTILREFKQQFRVGFLEAAQWALNKIKRKIGA